jgi:hypothetical protein
MALVMANDSGDEAAKRMTAALKRQAEEMNGAHAPVPADSTPDLPVGFGDEPDDDVVARPYIQIGTELHNTITASVEALATDRNVFSRDGALVDVVRATGADPEADSYVPIGGPKIRLMGVPTVRERLTRSACFTRWNGKMKRWLPCIPDDKITTGVVSRGEYPRIRPIVGILEAPSMRPDGSLIQLRGYDLRTGYLYEPSETFPVVPLEPTQADAARALQSLYEPFADFPFKLEAGRAAAVAAILTSVARPAIIGSCPAFIVDASTRGTGKSLTTDVIGTLATGRATAKMSWPDDDVELEKVLGGYAMRGAAIVNFDNVVRPFGGGPLDRCLTAIDTVELRVLGRSEVPAVLWRAIVLATGNNVALTGDTARRSIIIRLESPLEHPEDRDDFKIDSLVNWCRTNRARLMVAALTILRAYVVAGRPNRSESKRWGSFEAWSELVPRAIVFAGGANPLDARPAATDQEEPEKAALIGFMAGMQRLDPDTRGVSIRNLLTLLYPPSKRRDDPPDGYDDVREALEGLAYVKAGVAPTAKSVGLALKKVKRRVVSGRCLDTRPAGEGSVVWYVLKR